MWVYTSGSGHLVNRIGGTRAVYKLARTALCLKMIEMGESPPADHYVWKCTVVGSGNYINRTGFHLTAFNHRDCRHMSRRLIGMSPAKVPGKNLPLFTPASHRQLYRRMYLLNSHYIRLTGKLTSPFTGDNYFLIMSEIVEIFSGDYGNGDTCYGADCCNEIFMCLKNSIFSPPYLIIRTRSKRGTITIQAFTFIDGASSLYMSICCKYKEQKRNGSVNQCNHICIPLLKPVVSSLTLRFY